MLELLMSGSTRTLCCILPSAVPSVQILATRKLEALTAIHRLQRQALAYYDLLPWCCKQNLVILATKMATRSWAFML